MIQDLPQVVSRIAISMLLMRDICKKKDFTHETTKLPKELIMTPNVHRIARRFRFGTVETISIQGFCLNRAFSAVNAFWISANVSFAVSEFGSELPCVTTKTSSACSGCPFATNHRGDSGMNGKRQSAIILGIN